MIDFTQVGGVSNAAILAGIGTYVISKMGSVWESAKTFFFDHATAKIALSNDMVEYGTLSDYLFAVYGSHKLFKSNSYRPKFGMMSSYTEGNDNKLLQLGEGTFWIRHPDYGIIKAVIKKTDASSSAADSWRSLESFGGKCEMTLTFVTRRSMLRKFITDACAAIDIESRRRSVYYWDGYDFKQDSGTAERDWHTVILPKKQKARILADVSRFYSMAATYAKAGVPHRRGMLLYGPAGTGKTSLVKALHTELTAPVYVINLSLVSDKGLLKALREVEPRSIILFEDVDAQAPALRKGNNNYRVAKPAYYGVAKDEDETSLDEDSPTLSGITLSGFLNAIDGVQSPEHLYFIFTSNAPDCLDEAVVRNGRIDVKEHVTYLDSELQKKLIRNVMGDDCQIPALPKAAKACDVQAACLDMLIHNKQEMDATLIKDMS